MNVLNPLALWGLLALAVPVIVHFFNLQRPKQLLFSNVAFVREIQRTVVRRLKLRQLLLLALRLLAVAALVLAFSNPVLTGAGATGPGSRSVAILIDNSFSMTASNERGPYFQQALSLARSIIRSYGPQDEFLIMAASDPKPNLPFSGMDEALDQVQQLAVRQHSRTLGEWLSLGGALFGRASYAGQDLYLLSDFQQSTILADSSVPAASSPGIRVFVSHVGGRHPGNVYLTGHRIESAVLEPDKPVSMRMTLVNDGGSEVRDLSIRLLADGKIAAISNVSLPAGGSQEVPMAFTPGRSGWISGYAELDDQPVSFDNRRYFSIYVPEQEQILIVEEQSSRPLRILYQNLFKTFSPAFVSSQAFSTVDLRRYRAVIWAGMSQPGGGAAERLQNFVQAGGNLLIFPGTRASVPALNSLLGTLEAGSMAEAVSIESGAPAGVADLSHPAFRGIFSPGSGRQASREFDAPSVFRYYPLSPDSRTVYTDIIQLENRSPLLREVRTGGGTLYLFSTPLEPEWTDLQIKSIFTPLMFRLSQLMNQARETAPSQIIGAYTPWSVRVSGPELVQLVPEAGGAALTPEQYVRNSATTLVFDRMELQEGNYRAVRQDSVLSVISFNLPDTESRLAQADASALRARLDAMGWQQAQVLGQDADMIGKRIQLEREGTPLWIYFMLAGLLFLLLEIVVLRTGTSGGAPQPASQAGRGSQPD
ncbi:MAG: VWA domain-containing protein [Bacteroidia bacterium]|nr:VWA domain-containing protein [Bacteroidia bacterium]